MPGTSDVIYLYDGSFEGLLCCVHESVYTHELPVDIQPEEAAQPTLFRQKYIAADEEKAARVYDSIPRKISPDAAALVQCVFLSCMPGKELAILRFLLLGYRRGRQTMYLLSHTAVQPMLAARPESAERSPICSRNSCVFLTTTGLWPRPSRRKTMCSPF